MIIFITSILFVFVLFIILSLSIYRILSRNKEIINRILEKKLFRKVAEVYSHGGIHLLLLFFMAVCIILLFYNNDRLTKSITHTIIINVDDLIKSEPVSDYRGPGIMFDLLLNNANIKKETDNNFKDAIDLTVFSHRMTEGPIDSLPATISIVRFPNEEIVRVEYIDSLDFRTGDPIISTTMKPVIICDSLEIFKIGINLTNPVHVPLSENTYTNYSRRIRLYCNDFGIEENNPYYFYNLKFQLPEKDTLSSNKFQFTINLDSINRFEGINYTKKQIWIKEISPKPDIKTTGYIYYFSDRSEEDIRNSGGIFLEAEDLEVSNIVRQKEFQNSVLVGTCLAFALDIIIQLIIKLRNLNREHERDSKNRSELLLIENMEKKEDDEEQQQETNGIE